MTCDEVNTSTHRPPSVSLLAVARLDIHAGGRAAEVFSHPGASVDAVIRILEASARALRVLAEELGRTPYGRQYSDQCTFLAAQMDGRALRLRALLPPENGQQLPPPPIGESGPAGSGSPPFPTERRFESEAK